MDNSDEPYEIIGGTHKDQRGKIDFVNGFDLSGIKRNYIITHSKRGVVRAWQAHKIEAKWFFCLTGSFLVKLIKIDDWHNPSNKLRALCYELSEDNSKTLYIPPGYANGFVSLEDNSKLLIFSDYRLNELKDDDLRFPMDKWDEWEI
ncbi:dTDP-4-dehydrorhamnose 3,5-epimerase family protein [Flagellimonas lutimaris]|uniref:dTDP-4-dehydrorhamnose 3,5-epimerase family protein n=1 Tax=Flagellimonas lutimaris TaxID=475082 RepID=UPI003F5CC0A6